MQRAFECEKNTVVKHAFALHARAHSALNKEIGRPLLDQAGANAALDMSAAAVLENDGFYARTVQEMREHQTRRTGTDDPDLHAHRCPLFGPIGLPIPGLGRRLLLDYA